MKRLASAVLAATAFLITCAVVEAKPSGDTTVYHVPGKKRVHVVDCPRLTKDPAELAKLEKMTLAEAEAKGLPLCSKCPGSTTEGKGNPEAAPKEATPGPETIVYYAEGKGRVHVKGCRRLTTDPAELKKLKTMTLAEARKKGLDLCSRCPGSTTPGKEKPEAAEKLPESWVKPAPAEVTKKEFHPDPRSPLVSMGADGRLVYKPYTDRGDRIPDFSYCGYERSEVPIPTVPVAETLSPPAGEAKPQGNMKYPVGPDSQARIQAALDKVAAGKADANGFRGAVLLKKGTWYVSRGLLVHSGVVLRGEGDGPEGTVLIFTVPSGTGTGIQLGGARQGSSSESLTPVTGNLTKEKGVNGDDAYILTLQDGYRFVVSNPRFNPELKLEPYVGSRVTLMMKAITTTDGDQTRSRLKHNMPYEAKKVEAGQDVPPLDPNLELPKPVVGSGDMPESKIADAYVPSGSTQLTLVDASGFKPGDYVNIVKTTNAKWIEVLGMGERLRHIRGGKEGAGKKPWGPQTYSHLRRITAVNGNTIHFEVMLPQSIEAEHGGGFVRKTTPPTDDSQCGVEGLRIVSNYDTTVKDESKSSNFRNLKNGIEMHCVNGWARNCSVLHVWEHAVGAGDSLYCTVRDCKSLQPVGPKRGGRRYPFSIDGSTGILVYNCYSEDGRHDFVVGARTMGPNVFLKCTASWGGTSEPHHRWGAGTLYDSVTLEGKGTLASVNSGDSGTGHGWAGVNTVFWNCAADNIVVFDPETTGENNFAIGYTGPKKDDYGSGGLMYANTRSGYWGTPKEGAYYGFALMGNGYIESPDKPVKPDSLFVQQLTERIGKEKADAVLK